MSTMVEMIKSKHSWMNSIHDDVGDGVDRDVGDVLCDIFKILINIDYIYQIK
jgi:hypothetical protein